MLVDAFVGRQPIFDRDWSLYAYEVLYRSGSDNRAQFTNASAATSQVLVGTFIDIDIEKILGPNTGFVNMSREFLVDRFALAFPPDRMVVEVLEDVELDDEVLAVLTELSEGGYRIALDDFVFADHQEALLPLVDIVKVDIAAIGIDAAPAAFERLSKWDVELLAEKVETYDEFWVLHRLGFDYFQGYFLAKPEVIKGRKVSGEKASTMQLLSQLNDENASFDDLADSISRDVSLSYRLLKLLNSSFYGLPKEVDSVHQGLVLLGLDQITRWVMLIALASIGDKPPELMKTGLVRARMSELLGQAAAGVDQRRSFTVGLFSVLDALLDKPMQEVLEKVPLNDEATSALLNREGDLGRILKTVEDYERGDWTSVEHQEFAPEAVSRAYLDAIEWADSIASQLRRGR